MDGIQCFDGDGEDTAEVPANMRVELMKFVEWFELAMVTDTNGAGVFCQVLTKLAQGKLVRNLRSREIGAMIDTARKLTMLMQKFDSDEKQFRRGIDVLHRYQDLANA